MTKAEKAGGYFRKGFNCSQAVLCAFGPEFGLDSETAFRVAGAFGSGVARHGLMCGVVSGALMVIGLKHGMTYPENREAREKTYEITTCFIERFTARYGSIKCPDLLGCHIGTTQGMEHARSKGLFNTICPGLVAGAVDILENIIVTDHS